MSAKNKIKFKTTKKIKIKNLIQIPGTRGLLHPVHLKSSKNKININKYIKSGKEKYNANTNDLSLYAPVYH